MFSDLLTIYKEITFPYNIFALISISCIAILLKYIYNPEWLDPYRKRIVTFTKIVLALTVISSISFFYIITIILLSHQKIILQF